jgi:hypothetical protein
MLLAFGQVLPHTVLGLFYFTVGTGCVVDAIMIASGATNAVSEGINDGCSRSDKSNTES